MKIYVGMSGGVDSSVAAALLQERGFNVTGVYMKNWTQDLPGLKCPWADDLADAKRVAVQLGIDFKVFDFQKEYRQKVVDYMIAEYQAGRTPNPDIMCNQEIKFKLFLDTALEDGADAIATGHYARVTNALLANQKLSQLRQPGVTLGGASPIKDFLYSENSYGDTQRQDPRGGLQDKPKKASSSAAGVTLPKSVYRISSLQAAPLPGQPLTGEFGNLTRKGQISSPRPGGSAEPPQPMTGQGAAGVSSGADQLAGGPERAELLTALDPAKDQTYFLYRVTEQALAKTLFPIGDFTKPQIRDLAKKFGLATAGKKDSQGICFVGEVGIKEFLSQYVTAKPGDIVDTSGGNVIGQHEGAIFYTIGQRHGLGIGGGLPYYVVSKDMAKNIVYVTTDLNDASLWRNTLMLDHLHWINDAPQPGKTYKVRTRYRAPLVDATVQKVDGNLRLTLHDPERAITTGQSAVIYSKDRVVGGGIISETRVQ